jgi:hypothetical protein
MLEGRVKWSNGSGCGYESKGEDKKKDAIWQWSDGGGEAERTLMTWQW